MSRFKNLKMVQLLMISIGVVFVLGAILNIILVIFSMRQQSLLEAEAKAQILLDRNMATYTYFSKMMKPKLLEWTAPFRTKEYFDPSWMSSTYAIREIHKYFGAINPIGYYIKDAAINARSPENETDDFERAFLEKLRKDDKLESYSEVRMIDGKPYLTVLRKGETVEKSCLLCHGNPSDAPKGLLRLYGAERSFHRKVDDVISAISIRIPLSAAYASSYPTSLHLSILLAVVLALLFGIQFYLYRRFLISPIRVIRDKALAIAGHEERIGEKIPEPAGRELRELTDAFNEMSQKLRISRDHLEVRVEERTRELNSSNEQKETLLKEIHHRVKNNLQVVSSLLGMQSSYVQDEKAREIFQESIDRVRIMASIHTQLYQSQDMTWVNFGTFIRDLVGNLRQSYVRGDAPVEINVDADEMYLGIDQSIPCGLILNELIANALKHAFPEGTRGLINVSMKRDGEQIILKVGDNGIGLPQSIDISSTQAMGLQLVNILVRQINGKIEVQVDDGTTFSITFPIKSDRGGRNG